MSDDKLTEPERELQLESLRKNLKTVEEEIIKLELKKEAITSLIDKIGQEGV